MLALQAVVGGVCYALASIPFLIAQCARGASIQAEAAVGAGWGDWRLAIGNGILAIGDG